jgi:hypothetical protein
VAAEHRPYLAHLRNKPIDSTATDAGEVAAMLDSHGWRVVMDLIDEVHETALTRLLMEHAGIEGHPLDQAEYARLLGFLSGLRQTRWAAEAFIEHAERVRIKEG